MASATSTKGSSTACSNVQAEKRTIRERTALMINNPLMSDVKFAISHDTNSTSKDHGSELIYAHKFLLSLGSPVFQAMFYGNMADPRQEIPLSDCHPRSFIEFIRYLYSDEVHLTSGNVFELLYLAKKYIVPFLAESCCRFLTAELRESNVFRILEHARLFSESDLEQRCWRLLEIKTSACLQSEGLLWISRDTLSSLLKRDALTLVDGECAVFKAAKRWAIANCKVKGSETTGKALRKVLKEAIYLIRFPLMPPRLFEDIVIPMGILTAEEVSQVYLFHKQGLVTASDTKFSCIPRGPRLQSRSTEVLLCRCYRYRENQTFPSSESFSTVSESLKFSTNKEVYFAGVRLYAHKDEGRQFSVQLKISRCHGLKEEVSAVSGTFTVKGEPWDGGSRLGFDVIVSKPFLVSREAQFIIKITITGNDETRASPNKCIPMKFVKCEGVEFKFEGQSRQILELLFYKVDEQFSYDVIGLSKVHAHIGEK